MEIQFQPAASIESSRSCHMQLDDSGTIRFVPLPNHAIEQVCALPVECAVCYSNAAVGDLIVEHLDCQNLFCKPCYDQWTRTQKEAPHGPSCPICRGPSLPAYRLRTPASHSAMLLDRLDGSSIGNKFLHNKLMSLLSELRKIDSKSLTVCLVLCIAALVYQTTLRNYT